MTKPTGPIPNPFNFDVFPKYVRGRQLKAENTNDFRLEVLNISKYICGELTRIIWGLGGNAQGTAAQKSQLLFSGGIRLTDQIDSLKILMGNRKLGDALLNLQSILRYYSNDKIIRTDKLAIQSINKFFSVYHPFSVLPVKPSEMLAESIVLYNVIYRLIQKLTEGLR